jgi:hypothetical protein
MGSSRPRWRKLRSERPARVRFEAAYVDGTPNLRTMVNVAFEVMARTVTAHGEWPGAGSARSARCKEFEFHSTRN